MTLLTFQFDFLVSPIESIIRHVLPPPPSLRPRGTRLLPCRGTDYSRRSCATLAQQTLAPGATWTRYNCTATNVPYLPLLPATSLGPIVVNVVEAQARDHGRQ